MLQCLNSLKVFADDDKIKLNNFEIHFTLLDWLIIICRKAIIDINTVFGSC